jgi:hypothetical protein
MPGTLTISDRVCNGAMALLKCLAVSYHTKQGPAPRGIHLSPGYLPRAIKIHLCKG